MDINHSPLTPGSVPRKSSSKSNAQAASSRIGSMTSPGRTTPAKALSVGQTIRGQVTDLRNRQATITMEDGTLVTARLENAAQLSIGDVASFQVQEMNPGSIVLKLLPMSQNLVAGNAIMKALEEAGLPQNEKNIAIVRQLIDHQMPISKTSIQLLLRQSYQFKDADLSTLVLMNRHHIPVTEENVTQFESYRNAEHPILHKITDMSQEIPQLLAELTKENPGEVTAMFGKELLSLLPQNIPADGYNPSLPVSFLTEAQAVELIDMFPEDLIGKLSDYQAETGQLISILTPEELSSFASQTEDFPLPLPLKAQIVSGEAYAGEVMAALRDALPELSGRQATTLFQSPAFQELLRENILSGWTLDAKDLTKEKSVEKLYDSMEKSLVSLERLLKDALPDSEAAASLGAKAQHVQQNMDFMHTLNQFFPYIQLPLKLKEKLTHGDLYVFTKKKELAKKKGQISVLLHLDMSELGPLDIHLALNRNEVTSAFYVEDRSIERLLRTNIEELSEALSEKGYIFSSSFSIRERPMDIVKDFIEKDGPASGMKRYSFDIRA